MEYLSVAVFVILFALFLLYPKYVFTVKFLTYFSQLTTNRQRRLPAKTKLLCAVPFLNNSLLHRVMGHKLHAGIDKITGIVFCVIFLATTAEQIIVEINPWVIFVSWIALMVIYTVAWINDAILAFKMAILLERGHIGILCVLPPVCYFLLLSSIAPYFRKNKDELTGTFEVSYNNS